jgi:hypothetical protein
MALTVEFFSKEKKKQMILPPKKNNFPLKIQKGKSTFI